MTTAIDNNNPNANLLTLLHQYSSLHNAASTSFKSALWNITKARRGRGYQTSGGGPLGSSEYSVEGVREELEATALIEIRDNSEVEPELVDGDENDGNNKLKGNYYLLHFDGMEGAKCAAASLTTTANNDVDVINTENIEGLRRRKNIKYGESKSKWIEEQEQQLPKSTFYSDPLQLFGVPPPALRAAQSHSRDALAYYVEVADLARQIINIVAMREEEANH